MMEIDWSASAFALAVVSNVVAAAAWIYVHINRRHAATDAQVKAIELRVTVVETAIQALPTGRSWAQLREDIAGLRGEVRASATEIRGLGAGLKRVETQIAMLMENELRGKS